MQLAGTAPMDSKGCELAGTYLTNLEKQVIEHVLE
jgi:hypothetical protein